MAGNKKPRKPHGHNKRKVSAVGGLFAIQAKHDAKADAETMTDEQIDALAIAFRIAFQAMLSGAADEQQWSTCVCSLNTALVLAERGAGNEFEADFVHALDGAFRAKMRAKRTGAWGFDGEAIQAIKVAFDLHEQQIEQVSRREVREALLEVRSRIDAGEVYEEAA